MVIWTILLLVSTILPGQAILKGIVRDSLTREGLSFASISTTSNYGSVTADANGYFTLHLENPATNDSLLVSYVGYRSLSIPIGLLDSTEPNALDMVADAQLITIEVRGSSTPEIPSASVLRPSVAELERIPAILGEVDLLKSLSLLPGISGGTEGTATLNIRGGNPNQTDLLVDGNRIYNVNHIGGFLSALPSFATKAVTVYKGGIPARYGGRLSGVIDVNLKEGRRDRLAQSYTLGLGTIQAGIEGPLGEASSFLVNGRYSYPVLLYTFGNSGSYKRNESGTFSTVGLYDVVSKIRREYGQHVVTASVFLSGDDGWDQDDPGYDVATTDFGWGNRSVTIKHQYRTPGGGVWTNSAQYLNYRYVNRQRQFNKPGVSFFNEILQRDLTNGLNDASLSSEYSQAVGSHINAYAGITVHGHRFRAETEDRVEAEVETVRYSRVIGQDTLETAAYASVDLSLLRDRLQLMAGIRTSGLGFALPNNIEPRLRLTLNILGSLSLSGSYDRNVQYVHQLTPEVSIFPNELYLLANDRLPGQRSEQVALGLGGSHGNLWWSVEVYRKHLDDLVRLDPGAIRGADFLAGFPRNVIGGGKGEVEGAEVYLKKDGKALSWSIAYTLSRSDRQYATINNGHWFSFTFDRKHDLGITASKNLLRDWQINLAFIYQSGHRFTAPYAISAFYYQWGAYNEAQLPAFHLLNLGASKNWKGKKRPDRQHRLTLSTYNTYNRPNPYAVEIRPIRKTVVDGATGEETVIAKYSALTYSLFPLLPSASYTVTLK